MKADPGHSRGGPTALRDRVRVLTAANEDDTDPPVRHPGDLIRVTAGLLIRGMGAGTSALTCPGTWTGGRRRLRCGGYLSCDAAAAARDKLSVPQPGHPGDRVLTMVDRLETWVETRARLRDSTRRIYRSHIRLYFRRLCETGLATEPHG